MFPCFFPWFSYGFHRYLWRMGILRFALGFVTTVVIGPVAWPMYSSLWSGYDMNYYVFIFIVNIVVVVVVVVVVVTYIYIYLYIYSVIVLCIVCIWMQWLVLYSYLNIYYPDIIYTYVIWCYMYILYVCVCVFTQHRNPEIWALQLVVETSKKGDVTRRRLIFIIIQ